MTRKISGKSPNIWKLQNADGKKLLMRKIREDPNKQRDLLSLKTGKFNLVNVSTFPKLICTFPAGFLIDLYGKAKKVEYPKQLKKRKVKWRTPIT